MDYGELNKKTLNHSGSIPNRESTLEKIASCRYKTKKKDVLDFCPGYFDEILQVL